MLELVRSLAAERGKRTGRQTGGKAQPGVAHQANDIKALRVRLTTLVAGIDPDDGEGISQMRRSLLQEIVAWEFGADIVRDPEHGRMIDAIERAIDADPRMSERLRDLIRALKR
jgi:hypothetical protein